MTLQILTSSTQRLPIIKGSVGSGGGSNAINRRWRKVLLALGFIAIAEMFKRWNATKAAVIQLGPNGMDLVLEDSLK